jgi:hypothetical protein
MHASMPAESVCRYNIAISEVLPDPFMFRSRHTHASLLTSDMLLLLLLLQVTLMAENGDTREDLTLPKGTDDSEKLAAQLKEQFAGGSELIVSVLKSMGEEMINSFKAVNA